MTFVVKEHLVVQTVLLLDGLGCGGGPLSGRQQLLVYLRQLTNTGRR